MTTSGDDGVRRAAAELYGVPPAEFVPTRKRLADAVDDRAVAAAIRALPKPAAAAALVNAFVRADPDALPGLAEIGERLRAAEEDGDASALRTLAGERRQAVSSAAKAVVEGAGSDVSGSTRNAIEATLQASVLDPAAAAAVASGLLVKTLSPGADVDDVTALSVEGRLPSPERAKPTSAAKPSRAAETAARRAREAADRADKAADEAAARQAETETRLDDLRSERDELRERMAQVRDELSDLEERDSSLDGELTRAQRARRDAAAASRKARADAAALRRKAR